MRAERKEDTYLYKRGVLVSYMYLAVEISCLMIKICLGNSNKSPRGIVSYSLTPRRRLVIAK